MQFRIYNEADPFSQLPREGVKTSSGQLIITDPDSDCDEKRGITFLLWNSFALLFDPLTFIIQRNVISSSPSAQ